MIKKIKEYFYLHIRIQYEILETLASICKYLAWDGHMSRNPHEKYMAGHYNSILELSKALRDMECGFKC